MKLLDALHKRPSAFDFHVVMRRLECLYQDMPRWGEATRPSEEPIRLGQEPSLAFPYSMLASFTMPTESRPGSLWVRFFGLLGPNGPLPLHVTEYVRDRLRRHGDRTLSAFLDMFQHRMLVLFQRAWAVAQPTVAQDRPERNPFDTYLGALIGLGMPEFRGRGPISDIVKFAYAGRLASLPRNAEGLQAILADYLKCPVVLEQFVGEWLELPEDSRSRLGYSLEVSALGRTTVLGRRIWCCDHKFRLVLGPLSTDDFHSLLPGSERLHRLLGFVRSYVGEEYDWDLRLVLADNANRQVKLGRGDRLGLYAQLGKAAQTGRRDDVIIHPASFQTQRSSRKLS